MKRALILAILVLSATLLFAQQDPDPENLGRDTAQQELQEVSISKFEDSGFWRVYMPIDQGLSHSG